MVVVAVDSDLAGADTDNFEGDRVDYTDYVMDCDTVVVDTVVGFECESVDIVIVVVVVQVFLLDLCD